MMYMKIVLLSARYWREGLAACAFCCLLFFIMFFSIVPENSNSLLYGKLAPEVWRWEPVMSEYVKQAGLDEQQVPILLAIMMQESGGTAADVMQSSESAGLPPGAITDPVASIRQGVLHWKAMLQLAKQLNITDLGTIVQSYNYGPGWLYYMKKHNGIGTEDLRKQFSISYTKITNCGWRSPYCYGDYTYSVKVMRYFNSLQSGGRSLAFFQQVMNEALKYKGWPYSWGGATPTTSFDCSGLTQWVFAAAGIHLPRTAAEQYQYTERINKQQLQPGDLVFFTGTSDHAFISHVGIYVGDGKMYNSNSNGVGYSDLTKSVWRDKIYGYGRIPTGGIK